MYNDNLISAPNSTSIDTYPQTTAQRRGITLPPVFSFPITQSRPLFMSGRTHSSEIDSPSPTAGTLLSGRSPRRHRSLLDPRIKVRAASIGSLRSKKSVGSAISQSPSIPTTPSLKRTRTFGKFGVAAIIGPLKKTLNFKRLTLKRGGSKQKEKQKVGMGIQSYGGEFDSGKGLLERRFTVNMAFSDIDVDMDSQPLSARSLMEDVEMMRIDSPTTQFAAYTPCRDESDPFATPEPSATMNVDSGSPLSSITNSSPNSKKERRFAASQEAALRSRLKTLQVLGPEASHAVTMKYESEKYRT